MADSILWTYGCSFTQGMWEFDYRGDKKSEMWYPAQDASKKKQYCQLLPAGTGGSTVLAGALAGAHVLRNQAAEPVLYANRFV